MVCLLDGYCLIVFGLLLLVLIAWVLFCVSFVVLDTSLCRFWCWLLFLGCACFVLVLGLLLLCLIKVFVFICAFVFVFTIIDLGFVHLNLVC